MLASDICHERQDIFCNADLHGVMHQMTPGELES